MGICGSVDVQKSPLSTAKRQQSASSHSQPGGGGGRSNTDLYAVQPSSPSNAQGDGPVGVDPSRNASNGGGYDRADPYRTGGGTSHQQQQQHSSRHLASNTHRQSSTHRSNHNYYNSNSHQQQQQQQQHHQPSHQSSSHRYQHASPVRTADQAYMQQQSSRHRSSSNDRHRAATDYRDDYRHRAEGQRSHHHSSHHHQSDYYTSSSPRSSRGSSRFGSTRRKPHTVVPVTAENLQQHTRSYTTPKMHTVKDVIAEAVAEDKAARRSESFDMSQEEDYNYSEAGTKPFTMQTIRVKNDNGISSERSMASRNRRRTRTGNSVASGTMSSTASDAGYPSYETQESYGLHTPSVSRSGRMRIHSHASVGTMQSQFNGAIPAHKGVGGVGGGIHHANSSSRLAAPGAGVGGGGVNAHNSGAVSRSITDVPSIPEPHVAQHGHGHPNARLHHQQQQRVSSQHQLLGTPRAHTSPHSKSARSGTPQPNGDVGISSAATPTSMFAQHGDATPPPHNLSSADYAADSRHAPHASYAAANGVVDSGGGGVQPLNGHLNHNGGGAAPNGQEYEQQHGDFNQYMELGDDTQKSGHIPGMHNMGHVEGLGYTAAQLKQPLHSLSESY